MRVQEHYAKYVTSGGDGHTVLEGRAADLGYQRGDVVPDNLYSSKLFQASCGSGCPVRLPAGQPISDDLLIMDLGCGAGHDVLLMASTKFYKTKESSSNDNKMKVLGVDVTAEMVAAAQENAKEYPELAAGIEFIQSNLEDLDAAFLSRFQEQVDLIISNGVFNLFQDKQKAFQVAYHLLRPGGRFVISDVMKLEKNDINPQVIIATSINGDVFSAAEYRGVRRWNDTPTIIYPKLVLNGSNFRATHPFGRLPQLEEATSQPGNQPHRSCRFAYGTKLRARPRQHSSSRNGSC